MALEITPVDRDTLLSATDTDRCASILSSGILGVFDDFSKDSCHGGRMLGGCRQTVRSRYGGKAAAAAAAESVMTTIRQTTCKHCIAKHQFRKCVKECSYCCYFLAYPRSLQHCSTDTAEVILAWQRHLLL